MLRALPSNRLMTTEEKARAFADPFRQSSGQSQAASQPTTMKKADATERLQAFHHVGLLVNEPPGTAEFSTLPGCSLSSRPTILIRLLFGTQPATSPPGFKALISPHCIVRRRENNVVCSLRYALRPCGRAGSCRFGW